MLTAPSMTTVDGEAIEVPRMKFVNRFLARLIVMGVWGYRCTLGPFLGGHCRFDPTCSQYMLDAVSKYGPWRGGWRGIKRIIRCHPWGPCGYDPA